MNYTCVYIYIIIYIYTHLSIYPSIYRSISISISIYDSIYLQLIGRAFSQWEGPGWFQFMTCSKLRNGILIGFLLEMKLQLIWMGLGSLCFIIYLYLSANAPCAHYSPTFPPKYGQNVAKPKILHLGLGSVLNPDAGSDGSDDIISPCCRCVWTWAQVWLETRDLPSQGLYYKWPPEGQALRCKAWFVGIEAQIVPFQHHFDLDPCALTHRQTNASRKLQ